MACLPDTAPFINCHGFSFSVRLLHRAVFATQSVASGEAAGVRDLVPNWSDLKT